MKLTSPGRCRCRLARRAGSASDWSGNRHSLQIEIRRPLYVDEATRERHDGFCTLRDDRELLQAVAEYLRKRTAR